MLLVKKGDNKAYTNLYNNHISNIRRYFKQSGNVNGYSEDLAQKVLFQIWHKRDTFQENSTFKAFLDGFKRKILQEHRRKIYKESKLAKQQGFSQNQIDLFTPEKACLYAEQLKIIEINKSKLTIKQRQSIELSSNPDITPEKAAKKANCSIDTLRQRRFATRNKLKKLLNE